MRREVALTALEEGCWSTQVSVRGRTVRWEEDPARAVEDIDQLSNLFCGQDHRVRPPADQMLGRGQ